jgi:hypothetical protein
VRTRIVCVYVLYVDSLRVHMHTHYTHTLYRYSVCVHRHALCVHTHTHQTHTRAQCVCVRVCARVCVRVGVREWVCMSVYVCVFEQCVCVCAGMYVRACGAKCSDKEAALV